MFEPHLVPHLVPHPATQHIEFSLLAGQANRRLNNPQNRINEIRAVYSSDDSIQDKSIDNEYRGRENMTRLKSFGTGR